MNLCWKQIHIQKSEAKTFQNRQHADGQTKKPSPGITGPNGIDLSGAGSMRGQPIDKSQGQKTWVNFQILVPNLSFCAFICWANLRTVSKCSNSWHGYSLLLYLILLFYPFEPPSKLACLAHLPMCTNHRNFLFRLTRNATAPHLSRPGSSPGQCVMGWASRFSNGH